jgi:hypothetical protein
MRRCAPYNVIGLAVAAVLVLVAAPQQVNAEEPLRWKFEVGEKLDYTMVLEMSMSVGGDENAAKMRQEIAMLWDVQGVDMNTGEAVIRQKFNHLKTKLTSRKGELEYDSKSEAAPTGLAATLAPLIKALTQNELEIVMTSRGEIKDVKIPEDLLAAFKSAPGGQAVGEMLTETGFKKMVMNGALVLPEKPPKQGDTWKTEVELNNTTSGKQTLETTYHYEGTKDVGGVTYAVIKPQLKLEFTPAPKDASDQAPPEVTMKVVDQKAEGEALFNIQKGRLHSMTLHHNVTIEATKKGQTTQSKIEQNIDVKVTPIDDKKSPEAKPPDAKGEQEKSEKK